MSFKTWLSSPHMGGNELNYVKEAFDTNWIAPLGPNVDGFEKDIEAFVNNRVKAAALSSGTGALHLALIILGVKAGDDVICQSMTFSASANPISYVGALPVFVDSEELTWNISPELLETAIKDRMANGKKPKAIIAVHLYGMPAQMDRIMEISRRYEIPVIEDAAEALGSTFNGQPLGTFGDIGIYSFNGNKIITTSGGGALVSANPAYVEKARFLATQARDKAPHYQHSHIGFNYRMSNICAGVGRGQMEVLAKRVEQRRANFEFYRQAFSGYKEIQFATEPSSAYFSNHWLTTVLIESNHFTREDVRELLLADKIESRPLWKPMHLQPVFEGSPYYGNGISDRLFEKGLCLPSGSNLTDDQLNEVVARIKEAFLIKKSSGNISNNPITV